MSDPDATFIKKGNRELIFGYRPQIARSREGFVGAMIVPEGNASDKKMFEEAVCEWMRVTNVVPLLVSTDDGYTTRTGRWNLKGWGVSEVSFSGSKGKQITGSEEWESKCHREARRNRSAVESTIFTIKNNYEFDELSRAGIEQVRAELLEDVIAYNFMRKVQVRRKKRDKRNQEQKKRA